MNIRWGTSELSYIWHTSHTSSSSGIKFNALSYLIEPYINADDIKRVSHCDDLEAAVLADKMRNEMIDKGINFTFETVLSADRNLKLLQLAKEKGYFIRCIYVLTANPQINVSRVFVRTQSGEHDVPKDKILRLY